MREQDLLVVKRTAELVFMDTAPVSLEIHYRVGLSNVRSCSTVSSSKHGLKARLYKTVFTLPAPTNNTFILHMARYQVLYYHYNYINA